MQSVLRDAEAVVNGPRQEQYGDPVETLTRIGQTWAGVLGVPEISAKEVALCMATLKAVREANESHHRDNLIDLAGYAELAARAAAVDEEPLREGLRERGSRTLDGIAGAPCPDAPVCQSCPCADDDDVCFPCERTAAEGRFEQQAQIFDEGLRLRPLPMPDLSVFAVEGVGPTDAEREEFWADLGRPQEGFRVGDRVRVTNEVRDGIAPKSGMIGTVTTPRPTGQTNTVVLDTPAPHPYVFGEDRFFSQVYLLSSELEPILDDATLEDGPASDGGAS